MARLTTIIQGSKPKTISSNPLSYSGRQPKAGGIQSCKRRGARASSHLRSPAQPQALAWTRGHRVTPVSAPHFTSPRSPSNPRGPPDPSLPLGPVLSKRHSHPPDSLQPHSPHLGRVLSIPHLICHHASTCPPTPGPRQQQTPSIPLLTPL